ncbi:MAG TPA: PDZ domain-containing protein [Actinomycetota bacterium]|nr:PDZ domain-containing protein [Actinomycetota bacterium]
MESRPEFPHPISIRSRIPGWWRATLASTLLIPALVAGGLLYHTDFFALSPGPATDVSGLIRVEGDKRDSRGAFLITTVSVTIDTINVFDYLRASIDPAIEALPRSVLVGPGLTDEQQDEVNQADMEQSKYAATVVAMRAAGLNVAPIAGARVIKVFSGTPAEKALRDGDVIVSVGGLAVGSVSEMSEAIRAHPVGTKLDFGIIRGGKAMKVAITTTADSSDPSRPIIGIRPDEAFRLPVNVTIDSQDIVGPSGGLVFALAVADALTPGDLTRGHKIAATGTIALDGTVGRIGGVEQKVRAAEHVGADVFLVPFDEQAQAKAVARSIKVFGVRDIADAVAVLDGLQPIKRAA